MFPHPFVENLSDKTIDELSDTISNLNKKLMFASRVHNQSMINQLLMVLECYKSEYKKRQDEMWNKKSIDMSNKIDIN